MERGVGGWEVWMVPVSCCGHSAAGLRGGFTDIMKAELNRESQSRRLSPPEYVDVFR